MSLHVINLSNTNSQPSNCLATATITFEMLAGSQCTLYRQIQARMQSSGCVCLLCNPPSIHHFRNTGKLFSTYQNELQNIPLFASLYHFTPISNYFHLTVALCAFVRTGTPLFHFFV
jgi:hypothetical protein